MDTLGQTIIITIAYVMTFLSVLAMTVVTGYTCLIFSLSCQ
jgi:hypothetical protein